MNSKDKRSFHFAPYTVRQDAGASTVWRVFCGSTMCFHSPNLLEATMWAKTRAAELAVAGSKQTIHPMAGEMPFVAYDGRRVQYVFNSDTQRSGYLDLGTDLMLPDDYTPSRPAADDDLEAELERQGFYDDDQPRVLECPKCTSSQQTHIGRLGFLHHYRCRNCGFTHASDA